MRLIVQQSGQSARQCCHINLHRASRVRAMYASYATFHTTSYRTYVHTTMRYHTFTPDRTWSRRVSWRMVTPSTTSSRRSSHRCGAVIITCTLQAAVACTALGTCVRRLRHGMVLLMHVMHYGALCCEGPRPGRGSWGEAPGAATEPGVQHGMAGRSKQLPYLILPFAAWSLPVLGRQLNTLPELRHQRAHMPDQPMQWCRTRSLSRVARVRARAAG